MDGTTAEVLPTVEEVTGRPAVTYARWAAHRNPGNLSHRHNDHVIDHYRDLFECHQWLESGLCWIVVQPLNEEITVDDLLWRLNGGRDPEQRTMAYPTEEAIEEFQPVLFVFEDEGAWGFLEFTYGMAPSDRALTELSKESRVWMTTWHFKGGYTILYAADGKIRARMRDFIFTEHITEDGDPSVLADFRAMLDSLGPQDYRGKYSAAFAFIEAATGMGLESEWLDVEDAPVVILDNPDA
ncbi:hypothetical protein [Streptosporangium roseum]|uniref:Uncharacterized protein n=1 Tax=Streptosporangium roseum (strain ATCC 12428 / DSM 43021 / JCM 3005 / KCTC 9067 / NCIMB 10171 / NRRL 2505 / NI 9100) TaxID=479432 RepID=D2B442_STRRD|nr:hypothetical protein [Streptosporangium roseum]ACZ91276.1 hypothetical protein Sros_8634 [Streptosporangium roseum DSM 43021]